MALYSLSISFLILVYKKDIISMYQGINIKEVADISYLRDDNVYVKNATSKISAVIIL